MCQSFLFLFFFCLGTLIENKITETKKLNNQLINYHMHWNVIKISNCFKRNIKRSFRKQLMPKANQLFRKLNCIKCKSRTYLYLAEFLVETTVIFFKNINQ